MRQNRGSDYLRTYRDDRLTPYIEIDDRRLQRNLRQMQLKADEAGVSLRPHVKTHKSVVIARRQIAAGAVGITVSKPSEGVAFIEGGIEDVLLAYPVIIPESIRELLVVAAYRRARVSFIVAEPLGVEAIARAVREQGHNPVTVFVKVDVGLGRVGVNPHSEDGVTLAGHVARCPELRFGGLVSHAGHAYGASGITEIQTIAKDEATLLRQLQTRILQHGAVSRCALSTGATPTALGAPIAPGTDEIRPGNYALLDLTAIRLGLCQPDDLAMSVVARVVAINDRYAIIDAGSKALTSDRGPHGTGAGHWGIAISEHLPLAYTVEKLSEEHGFVPHQGQPPRLGSLMRVFPNHSCAVMAQFNSWVLRGEDDAGEVMQTEGRGCFL
ncbi:alanine racemase [Lonsdalea quercina]|uniref:alanine racemase n=1 Tax=Lonsdalea quercina TaxID=71657 RepID=UPI003975FCD6